MNPYGRLSLNLEGCPVESLQSSADLTITVADSPDMGRPNGQACWPLLVSHLAGTITMYQGWKIASKKTRFLGF